MPRWGKAEQDAGDHRHQAREQKHAQVKADFGRARHILAGKRCHDTEGTFGEKQAHYRAQQREQAAFREQLSRNSPLARSQCRARQQKVGDVGASNNQHKTDRPEENPKCAADVSNLIVQ